MGTEKYGGREMGNRETGGRRKGKACACEGNEGNAVWQNPSDERKGIVMVVLGFGKIPIAVFSITKGKGIR